MRYKLGLLLFSIFLIFGLTACSNTKNTNTSNAKDDASKTDELADELILFNWSEYMPQKILDDFQDEFGVKVVYSVYNSNQEMFAKMSSGTVAYDIIVPSDFYVQRMLENDLLYEINYNNIPNYKNIDNNWKGMDYDPENKYSVPYMFGFDGLAYNKTKIKTPPTSWEDLWNPAYKGHVIIMEDAKEVSNMMQQYLGNDLNDPTEGQLEDAAEKLKEIIPNLLAFDSTPEPQLVSGDAWIAYSYSGAAAVAWQQNKDVDFVLPKEGGVVWVDTMVIPKTSKNKYTAEVFMNYLLRPEVSKMLSEEFPYGNPNIEAVKLLDKTIQDSPGLNIPLEEHENAEWAIPLDPERTKAINRLFQEAKMN